jgi:catechol 2,3-dioxygenase-like lactoylglutathione lyase family enzyme
LNLFFAGTILQHIRLNGYVYFRRRLEMEQMTQQIQTLKAHLALNVKSVEQSIEFYKKMLGIEPCKVRTGYAKFNVQNPPLNLTLNQGVFTERGALSHMGIQVASTEDVLAMRERWGQVGLYTRDEMQTNCCYAVQDKTWVQDPDGNEWEVFVVLEDNLPETKQAVSAEAGSCSIGTNQQANSCCAPVAPVTLSR